MLPYFSSAGYIVKQTRSSLYPNTVNMLVCPQNWCRWHWSSNFQYISI